MGAGNSRGRQAEKWFEDILDEEDAGKALKTLEEDVESWNELWMAGWGIEQVHNVLTADRIRKVRDLRPSVLQEFLWRSVEGVQSVLNLLYEDLKVNAAEFRTMPAPYAFIRGASQALAIWARIVPFILEKSMEGVPSEFLWTPRENHRMTDAPMPSTTSSAPPLLGLALLNIVSELLFCPFFTVVYSNQISGEYTTPQLSTQSFEAEMPSRFFWLPGLRSKDAATPSVTMSLHRHEVLQCFLVLLSEGMYRDDEDSPLSSNHWLHIVACSRTYYSGPLFFSMLNQLLNHTSEGWGFFPSLKSSSTTTRSGLTDLCAQVLFLLLNYEAQGQDPPVNQYFQHLKSLTDDQDFHLLTTIFVRHLTDRMRALNSGFFRSGGSRVEFHQELLMLLWRILQVHSAYRTWLLHSHDLPVLVECLLYALHSVRRDSSAMALMHVVTYVLFLLSADRQFGVSLNRRYQGTLYIPLSSRPSTYADLLIMVLLRVLTDGQGKLEPLHDSLISVFTNIAPYVQCLGLACCKRLLEVFRYYSRPRYILRGPTHIRYAALMLEGINNMVLYQYSGNTHLIYTILLNRAVFTELSALDAGQLRAMCTKTAETAASPSIDLSMSLEEVSENSSYSLPLPERVASVPAGRLPKGYVASLTENDVASSAAGERGETNPSDMGEFVPTDEWFAEWRPRLQLDVVVNLLDALYKMIPDLYAEGATLDDRRVFQFLQKTTLVGLLPVPQPIIVRSFNLTAASAAQPWMSSYMWSVVYIRSSSPNPFEGTLVKAFTIDEKQ